MGFFDDVEYFFSGLTDEVGTLVEGTADLVSFTVGGLTELMTDGVKEMFIDGNTNYKTSYELKEEAQNRISKARSRLQSRYDEMEKKVKTFNEYAESVHTQKVALAERLGMRAGDKCTFSYRSNRYISTPSYFYSPSVNPDIAPFLGLNELTDIRGRKESAKDYLEDARDFEVEASGKIAEVNRAIALIEALREDLYEEEQIIRRLNEAVAYNRTLDRTEVGRQLQVLIAEYVLSEKGERNEVYRQGVEKLRQLTEG